MDAEPDDLSFLGRQMIEADQNYINEGFPAPRTRIGVMALETMYNNMMLNEEDGSKEDDS